MHSKILILIACFEAILSEVQQPEDINDLFPTIDNPSSDMNNVNTSYDIGKIDVKKLMQKMDSFNSSVLDKPINDMRRQVLVYGGSMSKWWYVSASDHMTRQKTTDLMLQTIYMARHIMKELEANQNFNPKDTGYRIGYVFKKLLDMIEKMRDIYAIMYKHRKSWHIVEKHLILHHKSVKLHTDFVHAYWVLIAVDGKHKEKNNISPKLPKGLKATGGISFERGIIG